MLRKTSLPLLAGLLVVAVALAGCHEPAHGELPRFTYTATEFAFEGPDELPAGWVRLDLVLQGQAPHHIQLLRLEEGKTLEDAMAAMMAGEMPEWAHPMGGPNTPNPGGRSSAIVHLEAGEYAMLCVIPDPEGTPHAAHGMTRSVRVVAEDDDEAEAPDASLSLSLHDFSFAGMDDWESGEHMVAVRNEGGQPHEAVLVRYQEGGNFSTLLQAFGPNATGPPPAHFLGGLTGFEAGDTQYFPADLEPGRYGLICFLEDPETGAPHFALGMETEFTIT